MGIWGYWASSFTQTVMDFEGQRKAEELMRIIISTCGVIGFIVGFYFQKFSYCVYTVFGGVGLCILLCLPTWPYLRGRAMNWVDTKKTEAYWQEEARKATQDKVKQANKQKR
eukprot:TRINITY_DN85082_c0_g1_i1.p1 TRINITY_DN85082_c0_g1~~TRINITY_DN85082_c0_g1_i1.p1  ORF type:complete len:112 (-),score=6.42 TRINITY_DN85082_c0_g1_i1:98-433(-)